MATDYPRVGSKRVTLNDVARHAGVSRALVSIVMRDAPGASESTRQRVMASASELGYRPDARARSLAGHSSKLIGVVFGTAFSFHFDLLDGLYMAAEELGYSLLLSAMTPSRAESQALQSLHDFQFDALIMLGPATAEPLLAGQLPVVVMGWHVDDPRVDVVRTSDEVGLNQAVGHLAALGHRKIIHIDGGDSLVSDSRRNSYMQAMKDHGLGRHIRILQGGETALGGQRAAHKLIRERRTLPTAVISYNDVAAVSLMGVLRQQGISVPKQLSVVGYDNSALAADPAYDLTSIAQAPQQMARRAIERLHQRLRGDQVTDREIVLEPELVIRGSTSQPTTNRLAN